MVIICTKFPYSSSRELGMALPLFIHPICSFVFAKGSVLPLLCHWFLVGVDATGSVSGACSPYPPLMVWCIQLISVRGPLPLPLLPGNPSGSCVPSFQDGDVPRERRPVPQGWHMCSGQDPVPPRVLVPSPLISLPPGPQGPLCL